MKKHKQQKKTTTTGQLALNKDGENVGQRKQLLRRLPLQRYKDVVETITQYITILHFPEDNFALQISIFKHIYMSYLLEKSHKKVGFPVVSSPNVPIFIHEVSVSSLPSTIAAMPLAWRRINTNCLCRRRDGMMNTKWFEFQLRWLLPWGGPVNDVSIIWLWINTY